MVIESTLMSELDKRWVPEEDRWDVEDAITLACDIFHRAKFSVDSGKLARTTFADFRRHLLDVCVSCRFDEELASQAYDQLTMDWVKSERADVVRNFVTAVLEQSFATADYWLFDLLEARLLTGCFPPTELRDSWSAHGTIG